MRPSSKFLAITCMALLLTLGASGAYNNAQAAPTKTPTGSAAATVGIIAVLDSSGGLYVINTDGKNFKQLEVAPDQNAQDLAWSPDGNHLAFMPQSGDATVVNPDGSNPQAVKGVGRGFAWTPDSKQLTIERNGAITSTDVATGQQTPVTTLKKDAGDIIANLRWSADGKSLLYIAKTKAGPKLHVFDVGSGDDQVITTQVTPSGARWNPAASQASKLAYYGVSGGKGGIFIYDLATKATTPVFDSYLFVAHADWSPDGKQFVYDAPINKALAIVDISTKKTRPLPLPDTVNKDLQGIAWQPVPTGGPTGGTTGSAATMAPTAVATAAANVATAASASQSTAADGTPAPLTQTFVASDKSFSFKYPANWGSPSAETMGDPGSPGVTLAMFVSGPTAAIVMFFPAKFTSQAATFLGTTGTVKKTQLTIGGHPASRLEGNLQITTGPGVLYSVTLDKGNTAYIAIRGTPDTAKPLEPTLQAVLASVQVPAASG